MKLSALYSLQKKSDLKRGDKYKELVRQKYASVKISQATDKDKYWQAYKGIGDNKDVRLVMDTIRFFSDQTIKVLDACKCFTEPLDYSMQSRYFLSSRKLVSDKIATIPAGESTVLILFSFSGDEGATQYCCYIQPYALLSKETQEITTPSKARDWFIYTVNCLAFINMPMTSFVNIDDDEKLEAARKRVDCGDFELPLQELAFMNYIVYPWESAHVFLPIFANVRRTAKGYKKLELGKCDRVPEIKLPAVDLDKLEDKLYNFFVYQMRTQKLVGADTETTGLNVFFSKIVSLGLTFNLKLGYYLSFRHTRPQRQMLSMQSLSLIRFFAKNGCKGVFDIDNAYKYYDYIDKENSKNLSIDTAKAICNHLKTMQSVWHNARYDYSMIFEDFGIDLPVFMDTMLAHYVARPGYNANREKSGLKIIAPEELEVESWKIDVTKVQDDFKDIEAAYNARDCCYMYGIALSLGDELLKPSVWDLFEIEMKYLPVLVGAELAGVRLDAKKLKDIELDLSIKRDRVINHITSLFGEAVEEHFDQLVEQPKVFGKPFLKDKVYLEYVNHPDEESRKNLIATMKSRFNINSNQLMKFFFFGMMGVIPPRKCPVCGSRNFEGRDFCNNPSCKNYNMEGSVPYEFVSKVTGEPSFDKNVKEKLSEAGNPLMKELDEYSAAHKLITSYCNLDEKINPLTGNIHPSYNQARTATGRLCLVKGTLVEVVRNLSEYPKGIPIEQVKKGDLVYTYDDDRNLTIRKVTWAGKTGRRSRIIRLHWLGSGHHTRGYLDLTPNHEVRLTTGEYRRSELLSYGDRVLSMSRSGSHGYSRIHAFGDLEIKDHIFISKHVDLAGEGDIIHHKDGNKLNNNITNLMKETRKDHSRRHGVEIMKNSPDRVATFIEMAKKYREEHPGEWVKRGEEHPGWLGLTSFQIYRELVRVKGKSKFVKYDYNCFVKHCKLNNLNYRAVHYRYTKEGTYIPFNLVKILIRGGSDSESLRKSLGITKLQRQRLYEHYANNHMITKVEEIEGDFEVYDIEVEETHNFIANEVCVHNSSHSPNFCYIGSYKTH